VSLGGFIYVAPPELNHEVKTRIDGRTCDEGKKDFQFHAAPVACKLFLLLWVSIREN
jgi:hypothetical protein